MTFYDHCSIIQASEGLHERTQVLCADLGCFSDQVLQSLLCVSQINCSLYLRTLNKTSRSAKDIVSKLLTINKAKPSVMLPY